MLLAALALSAALVRIPAPPASDLNAARFGSRTWPAQRTPSIPFRPDVETFTMGSYGTMPSQALHIGNAWFLAYFHGEFGGALWQFNADGSVGKQLLAAPTYDLVRFGDEVLAATGFEGLLFRKPLRIHRFAKRDGAWREIRHAGFPYNLADLTAIDGRLYAMAVMHQGRQTLAEVSLSGTIRPLWETSADLDVTNIAAAPGGGFTIGARGYVVQLLRSGNTFAAQWYAPRDCVRYTHPGNPFDARCIGAPGSESYVRTVMQPATGIAAVSQDGTWMFAQRGPHLLHFAGGRWNEVALPEKQFSIWTVGEFGGAPVLGTSERFFKRSDGTWKQIGPALQCSSPARIGANVAWCAGSSDGNWRVSAIRPDGSSFSADLGLHLPPAQMPMLAAGPSGDAWFSIPNAASLGRVNAQGIVSRIALSAPAAIVQAGRDKVWFTESDARHYGFVDAQAKVHEFSRLEGFPVRGILPATHGAWLEETFAGGRPFFRHVRAGGTLDNGVYLPDASGGVVTSDGALYALGTKWPAILRLTEDGALSRYRLPCADGFTRLSPAPNDGVWFVSNDPGCSGIIEKGEIHVRNLPLVQVTEYK